MEEVWSTDISFRVKGQVRFTWKTLKYRQSDVLGHSTHPSRSKRCKQASLQIVKLIDFTFIMSDFHNVRLLDSQNDIMSD